jgi:hypothetical protein
MDDELGGIELGFSLAVIAIASVLAASLLPIIFLRRHPGQKMDDKGYRAWLV